VSCDELLPSVWNDVVNDDVSENDGNVYGPMIFRVSGN